MENRSKRVKGGQLSFGLLIALLFVAVSVITSLNPMNTVLEGEKTGLWNLKLAINLKSMYMSDFDASEFNGLKIEKSTRSVFSNNAEIEIINYHITEGNRSFEFEKIGEITNILY